ncbi:MAG: hypothetical protein IPJ25_11765 [Rhodocyclaceae bacterium]|nr:hypothetical protein [Rhodocyclaceae bacterium]
MSDLIHIYLDTEFTDGDLLSVDDLLSIGFVAELTDDELYIEITDRDPQCRPSEFVREVVLPLFGRHHPERRTRAEAAVRIAQWLDELRDSDCTTDITLVSDSAFDWIYLLNLLDSMAGQPSWVAPRNIRGLLVQSILMPCQIDVFFDLVNEYHEEHQEQHHALVDARSLKVAMSRVGL